MEETDSHPVLECTCLLPSGSRARIGAVVFGERYRVGGVYEGVAWWRRVQMVLDALVSLGQARYHGQAG